MSLDRSPVEVSTPAPAEEGAPQWTVTFGDMMSLLLTFFILLFSMSELKMDRFLLASQSMREAMGGTAETPIDDPIGLMPDPMDPQLHLQSPGVADATSDSEGAAPESADGGGEGDRSVAERLADEYMERIVRQLLSFAAENGLEETLLVDKEPGGVRVRVNASALFRPGSGTVEAESAWIIDFLADLTEDLDVPVVVAGHADNQPIRNAQFASNWELSAVRAAGVARELVDHGHEPERIRVESFERIPQSRRTTRRKGARRIEGSSSTTPGGTSSRRSGVGVAGSTKPSSRLLRGADSRVPVETRARRGVPAGAYRSPARLRRCGPSTLETRRETQAP